MKKTYLLTPGPTPVPPEVLETMSRPIIHHRTAEFQEIFKQLNEGLKYVFCTKEDVLTFATSGTGVMEGCVSNLLSPQDKVIVVKGGKFGERWAEICDAYNVNTIAIDVEWGKAVSPSHIKDLLKNNTDVKAVFTTHCETSTGTATDIKSIADAVSKTQAVLVVDAVSSLGAMELQKDNWGVDVVVSGSQKGLMIPPGLGFCTLSQKAWQIAEKSAFPKYYFDFIKARAKAQKNDTPYTPAVSLIIALNKALHMIKEEGLENVLRRHSLLARAVRAAVKAMGMEVFSSSPANAVTAVKSPNGIDSGKLVNLMRTKYGVGIAGGQAKLKGRIFRIAHLGYMNEFDIIIGLSALGMALAELGYRSDIGKGINAAQAVFNEAKIELNV